MILTCVLPFIRGGGDNNNTVAGTRYAVNTCTRVLVRVFLFRRPDIVLANDFLPMMFLGTYVSFCQGDQ